MKYIRITTTQVDCRTCQGSGYVWDKEYHNQLKRLKCYLCDNGKITIEHHEDVTEEANELTEQLKEMSELRTANKLLKEVNQKLRQAIHYFFCERCKSIGQTILQNSAAVNKTANELF